MPEPTHLPPKHDRTLKDSIQQIYRVYGPNLAAFFRDVEDPKSHVRSGLEPKTQFAGVRQRKRDRVHTAR